LLAQRHRMTLDWPLLRRLRRKQPLTRDRLDALLVKAE
jgi:hypothetical protein